MGGVNAQICLLTVGLAAACWYAVRLRSAKSRPLLLSSFRVDEVLKDEVRQRKGTLAAGFTGLIFCQRMSRYRDLNPAYTKYTTYFSHKRAEHTSWSALVSTHSARSSHQQLSQKIEILTRGVPGLLLQSGRKQPMQL